MSIITLCSRSAYVYMNSPSGFDTMPNTCCLCLKGCIYGLRVSALVVFMLKREVNRQVGCTRLMADKCVFVKLENNIIGVPVMQSSNDIIDHGFWFL